MTRADLIKGAEGERVAWDFFQNLDGVRNIFDVRQDKFFQSVDVDFLVEHYNRQVSWVEVKTDYQADRTGNIAYEVVSNAEYNTLGCLEKTKANWIAYYIPGLSTMFLIKTEALRKEAHSGRYERRKMGDFADGYLIPLATLERKKIAFRYGV